MCLCRCIYTSYDYVAYVALMCSHGCVLFLLHSYVYVCILVVCTYLLLVAQEGVCGGVEAEEVLEQKEMALVRHLL